MISFDLVCINEHIFEGSFKDYDSYKEQLESKKISCPLCGETRVKRKFSGCSIHARPSGAQKTDDGRVSFIETLREFNNFVKNTTVDVGTDFADKARAMHYGIEEEKPIRGESSVNEIKELSDEGIEVFPIVDVKITEN